MVFLGFGKYARADRIYALEPLTGDDRGDGRRTRVWIEGIAEPIIASRTERTILAATWARPTPAGTPLVDEAVALAERIVADTETGRSTSPTSAAGHGTCSSRRRASGESDQLF